MRCLVSRCNLVHFALGVASFQWEEWLRNFIENKGHRFLLQRKNMELDFSWCQKADRENAEQKSFRSARDERYNERCLDQNPLERAKKWFKQCSSSDRMPEKHEKIQKSAIKRNLKRSLGLHGEFHQEFWRRVQNASMFSRIRLKWRWSIKCGVIGLWTIEIL